MKWRGSLGGERKRLIVLNCSLQPSEHIVCGEEEGGGREERERRGGGGSEFKEKVLWGHLYGDKQGIQFTLAT